MQTPTAKRSNTPSIRRTPGRPRCDVTRQAVLAAAYELLGDGGLRHFTIEAVATRSGVARTTIYRWWPSKGALAVESFLDATAPDLLLPPSGSAAQDIRMVLHLFARLLRGPAGRIIRSIVAEGQGDPETLEAFRTLFVTPRRAAGREILQHSMQTGELRPGLDIEMVLYSLFGPLYVRMLLNEGLDEDWVDRLSDVVLAGCLEPSNPS